jgi:hypothetical protein
MVNRSWEAEDAAAIFLHGFAMRLIKQKLQSPLCALVIVG